MEYLLNHPKISQTPKTAYTLFILAIRAMEYHLNHPMITQIP